MPKFELLPVNEAMAKSSTGKRAQISREYQGYIDRLSSGQAGKLDVAGGESASAVRRRLGAAAKATGKDVVIRRTGDTVFFWMRGQEKTAPRRRGRPRKNPV